jgi:ATP/ADP translocase
MEQVVRSQREAQDKRKANISEKVKKRKDKKMGIKPKKSPKVAPSSSLLILLWLALLSFRFAIWCLS